MTTHLIFAVLCLGVASASLIDVLKTVHQNPTFKTLPQRSQILIIELIAETEAGEVKNYIDIVGFEKVISVIDSLPQNEAHMLRQYLIQELQIEEQNTTTATPQPTMPVVGKRDLVTVLKTVANNAAFQNLPSKDQQFVRDMLTAAESNQLSAFISTNGYSSVLQIIEYNKEMQNIDQIGPQTTELVAHEFVFLLENYPNYFDDFTGWLSAYDVRTRCTWCSGINEEERKKKQT